MKWLLFLWLRLFWTQISNIQSLSLNQSAFQYMGVNFVVEPEDSTSAMAFLQLLLDDQPNAKLLKCDVEEGTTKFSLVEEMSKVYVVTFETELGNKWKYNAKDLRRTSENEEVTFKTPNFEVRVFKCDGGHLTIELGGSPREKIEVFVKVNVLMRQNELYAMIHPNSSLSFSFSQPFYSQAIDKSCSNLSSLHLPNHTYHEKDYFSLGKSDFSFKLHWQEKNISFESNKIKHADWMVRISRGGYSLQWGDGGREMCKDVVVGVCGWYRMTFKLLPEETECRLIISKVTIRNKLPCLIHLKLGKDLLLLPVPNDHLELYAKNNNSSILSSDTTSVATTTSSSNSTSNTTVTTTKPPKWAHAFLTGGIVLKVEKSIFKQFEAYVRHNLTNRDATHLIYLSKYTEGTTTRLHKDYTVRECSVIIHTLQSPSRSVSFTPDNPSNDERSQYRTLSFGDYLSIFQTSQMPTSTVELDGKGTYGIYVLCQSFVEQQWKFFLLAEPEVNVVNIAVETKFVINTRLKMTGGRYVRLLAVCRTEVGDLVYLDYTRESGTSCLQVVEAQRFHCYVKFGEKFLQRRYYPHLVISSALQVKLENPLRLRPYQASVFLQYKKPRADLIPLIHATNNTTSRYVNDKGDILKFMVPPECARESVSVVRMDLVDGKNASFFHTEVYILNERDYIESHDEEYKYQWSYDDPSWVYMLESYATTQPVFNLRNRETISINEDLFTYYVISSTHPLSTTFIPLLLISIIIFISFSTSVFTSPFLFISTLLLISIILFISTLFFISIILFISFLSLHSSETSPMHSFVTF